ncbi:MAG: hypothetical protein ACJ8AT_39535 [Hyalangium sp.]|uniref:hypothetical protein n=1 Tax=Hyalangium sp. TaxID=2028555 RepID=UPI00389B03EC
MQPVGTLQGSAPHALGISDLDRRFNLRLRTLMGLGFSSMYAGFVRDVDVAALRRQGIVSVLSFVDFECNPVALPVGQEAKLAYSIRLCRAPVKATDQGKGRLMFEVQVELTSMPGTGDPKRYRDVAEGAAPVQAGRSRLVLVLTRPSAPAEQRLVTETPAELSMLQEHPLEDAEAVSSLSDEPPAGYEAAEPAEPLRHASVWGLHHTDINQAVFTGEYVTAMEDHFARLAQAARLPVAQHQISRVQLLLKRPFMAGDAYELQGRLFKQGEKTLLLGGVFPVLPEGTARRASVVARLEGGCTAPAASPGQR